jgi:hypothetical protein
MSDQFHLHLNVKGAAIVEDPASAVGDILIKAAAKVRAGEQFGRIFDENGNRVGFWHFGDEGDQS